MLQRQSNQAVVVSSSAIIWWQHASDDKVFPANRRPGNIRPAGATSKKCLWREAGENKAKCGSSKVSQELPKENIPDRCNPKCSAPSPQ